MAARHLQVEFGEREAAVADKVLGGHHRLVPRRHLIRVQRQPREALLLDVAPLVAVDEHANQERLPLRLAVGGRVEQAQPLAQSAELRGRQTAEVEAELRRAVDRREVGQRKLAQPVLGEGGALERLQGVGPARFGVSL